MDRLRRSPLPAVRSTPAADVPPSGRGIPPGRPAARDEECAAGDDRVIRAIAPAFALAWQNQDAQGLADLWWPTGDMAHPDGFVERTAQIIRQNRAELFMRREYRGSRHSLAFGTIRCLTPDVAVADGKWELRGVTDENGQPTRPSEGLFTLVLKRRPGGWGIAAWRYNVKPAEEAPGPNLLSRPGFLGPVRRR